MQSTTLHRVLLRAALLLTAATSLLGGKAQAQGVDYATTIQPIYTTHCITCHGTSGPDAGLNLQTNSYTNTVNKTSGKYGTYRVCPNFATNALSSIYNVVVTQGTGARHQGLSWATTATQKTNLTNWINQGALPNLNAPTVTSLNVTSGVRTGTWVTN